MEHLAAAFDGFTLEEFDKFINRTFRAFDPERVGSMTGEYKYLLYPEPEHRDYMIEVLSTVDVKTDLSRPIGTLSLALIVTKGVRIDRVEKAVVKRTNNWRETLTVKIYDLVETYLLKYDPTPHV